MAREIVTLECTETKDRNYTTTKNKKKTPNRLELKKIFSSAASPHGSPRGQVEEPDGWGSATGPLDAKIRGAGRSLGA